MMTDNEHNLLLKIAAILTRMCRDGGRDGEADVLVKLVQKVAEESEALFT
jgi:hypothetical protein